MPRWRMRRKSRFEGKPCFEGTLQQGQQRQVEEDQWEGIPTRPSGQNLGLMQLTGTCAILDNSTSVRC